MATTNKRNLSQKQKPSSQDKPAEVMELQALTLAELEAIAGGTTDHGKTPSDKLGANHNETVVKLPHLAQKQKSFSEGQPAKVKEMQALTLAELEAIAGGGIRINHNETVVKFPPLLRKQKSYSEVQPAQAKELQSLTITELEAIAGAGGSIIQFNHNETMVHSA